MEHHLLQPQHLMGSPGFFNLSSGGNAAHFPSCGGCGFAAGPVGLHTCGWAAGDTEQLGLAGGEMFGGGVNTIGASASTNIHRVWQCDGGALDGPLPAPACISGGDGRGNFPLAAQRGVPEPAVEPQREDDGSALGKRKGKDRAKTIVLERKRRVRMTEKLYQLRSLVPNITKMDKASIIGDAVEYVKNLQSHARKLEDEVAALEARQQDQLGGAAADRRQDDDAASGSGSGSGGGGHGALVARVGATRVGEERFLVTVECEGRDGAAARLVAAFESLACFHVEASSLGRSAPDRLVSTATLKATCQVEAATIGEATVKLLVVAALGDQGFRIEAAAGIS